MTRLPLGTTRSPRILACIGLVIVAIGIGIAVATVSRNTESAGEKRLAEVIGRHRRLRSYTFDLEYLDDRGDRVLSRVGNGEVHREGGRRSLFMTYELALKRKDTTPESEEYFIRRSFDIRMSQDSETATELVTWVAKPEGDQATSRDLTLNSDEQGVIKRYPEPLVWSGERSIVATCEVFGVLPAMWDDHVDFRTMLSLFETLEVSREWDITVDAEGDIWAEQSLVRRNNISYVTSRHHIVIGKESGLIESIEMFGQQINAVSSEPLDRRFIVRMRYADLRW